MMSLPITEEARQFPEVVILASFDGVSANANSRPPSCIRRPLSGSLLAITPTAPNLFCAARKRFMSKKNHEIWWYPSRRGLADAWIRVQGTLQ